jgi:hypothetical protein
MVLLVHHNFEKFHYRKPEIFMKSMKSWKKQVFDWMIERKIKNKSEEIGDSW